MIFNRCKAGPFFTFSQFLFALIVGTAVISAQPGPIANVHYIRTLPPDSADKFTFNAPQAIAVDLTGNLFVVDTGNNRVMKLDSLGNVLASVGGFGWESEQFDQALDISAKSTLDVFIADFNNERIERYDRDLNYISAFLSAENTAPELRLNFPVGVDFSRHGELFIADSENDRVLKMDSFGKPVLTFGDFNSGEGQLEDAGKLEVGDNDAVYVIDRGRNDIVAFDYYGNFLLRFGEDSLLDPQGLFWTPEFIFVANSARHQVRVFDQRGNSIYRWGEKGNKFGAFNTPCDIAVFGRRIFVLDSGNNRVQIFEIAK